MELDLAFIHPKMLAGTEPAFLVCGPFKILWSGQCGNSCCGTEMDFLLLAIVTKPLPIVFTGRSTGTLDEANLNASGLPLNVEFAD